MRLAHDVIRHHHEKWDGTGYPDHLQGDAIPLGARILAIADSYDALTTWRCYKAATNPDRALDVIQQASGKHFDSRLVETFVQLSDQLSRD
jgi:putative two-component system response regulator